MPLTIDDLRSMDAMDWVCALKLDGTRVILAVFEFMPGVHASVLLTRDMKVYRVKMSGPKHALTNVLFDAELMDDGTLHLFDCMHAYDGRTPYRDRWDTVNAFVKEVSCKDLELKAKPIYDAVDAPTVFCETNKFSDGIIFTRNVPMDRGSLGRTKNILKWKPSHSVDLLVHAENELCWRGPNGLEPVDFAFRIKWGKTSPQLGKVCEFDAAYRDGVVRLRYVREREQVNSERTVRSNLACALEGLDIASVGAVLLLQ